jgi:hypothetical protein
MTELIIYVFSPILEFDPITQLSPMTDLIKRFTSEP